MKVKDQILELRNLGYSYRQIEEKLNCSKGTIAYHCGDGQKNKTTKRRNKSRLNQHPLARKIENFNTKYSKPVLKLSKKNKTFNRILRLKIEAFSIVEKGVYNNMSFTVQEFLNKVGDKPACSLTGRSIDLMKPRSYQLDHIVPRAKGGDNSLDNCQLTCKEANQAKHELTVDEFISLCREVVNHVDTKSSERGI
jgi:5-methylcytosine-specific restriction endonuclease McrA